MNVKTSEEGRCQGAVVSWRISVEAGRLLAYDSVGGLDEEFEREQMAAYIAAIDGTQL